jgi:hypothetical protein
MTKKKSWSAAAKANATKTPNKSSLDNTTDILALSSGKDKKNCGLLAKAVTAMIGKLSRAHWWLTGVRTDGSVYKIPATVRGNNTYAYYQSTRIRQIQTYLTDNLRIKYHNTNAIATNALFITLTQRYDTRDESSIEKTWTNAKAALKKFKMRMRRMGMTEYAMTLEAHANGGCHAHMIAMFGDRGFGIHKCLVRKRKWKHRHGKEYVYRLNDTGLLGKIKKAWADALRYSPDGAFVDVIGCGDSDLVDYITKELKKASSCETAIKLLQQNDGTIEKERIEAAQKKVLAFYLADKLKMRLLHVSKGIEAGAEPEEGELPEADLIKNVISDQSERPQVLYSCIITRKELLKKIKHNEISPYTGTVDPETAEYTALMSIFEQLYGISRILKDKEECKKVIMAREERKNMKIQTKIIAKEAIYA